MNQIDKFIPPIDSAFRERARNDYFKFKFSDSMSPDRLYSHGYFDRVIGLDQSDIFGNHYGDWYKMGWLDADGDIAIYLENEQTFD